MAKNERFGVSDELWAVVKPLLPRRRNSHPSGGGRKPTEPRRVFAAILFVWRTGCQWRALDVTGLCAGTTTHDWFQRWTKAGVFERLWEEMRERYDELVGLDWSFVSVDGCMTKAPLGGEKNRAQPHRPRQVWHQTEPGHRRGRGPARRRRGGSQLQ
jgi:putative transposase